jgi:antitoxin component YwqK of YwqJK toxin-antitoxin module
MNKKFFHIAISGIIILIIINLILNRWIQEEVRVAPQLSPLSPSPQSQDLKESSPVPPQPISKDIQNDQPLPGEVVRKTRVERGSDLIENVFYQNGKEIARQTIFNDGHIEEIGEVPDGKVTFYDQYSNAHGEEYYLGGKRHGRSKTYYPDGRLRSEGEYRSGKLYTNKEYYANGNLLLEIDYSDARYTPKNEKEIGIGKLYFPDGKLKYEWNLTNSSRIGFKKSYNTDGTLRAATYYDQNGQVVKKEP